MSNNNKNNSIHSELEKFINEREQLSSFDKNLLAAKIIDQIDSVDVDDGYKKVSQEIRFSVPISHYINKISRFAAILSLPLLIFTIWSLFFQKAEKQVSNIQDDISWQDVNCPVGMRSQVLLPDGTRLWLNGGSKLRYGIPFIGETRSVELSGEAFFEVHKFENSPFIVKSGIAEVEVLGTQFNVNARPESEKIEIALKEGNVQFKFKAEKDLLKFTRLKPNDYLVFDKTDKSIQLENKNIEKYISWHQNIMILDDTPMVQLAQLIEQWYGVKVVIANEEIKRYKFTTTFVNEPLHRILELLEISSPGIKIIYTPGKPIKGTKEFSPSVVTIDKK